MWLCIVHALYTTTIELQLFLYTDRWSCRRVDTTAVKESVEK